VSTLDVRDLMKTYANGARALENVCLHVAHGKIVALLGPSGCGKTTLLRLVAGLDRADHGRIEVDGRTVAGAHLISAVFQEPRLMPWLNSAENIAVGAGSVPAAERPARIAAMLARIGLAAYGGRLPKTLSGGQQQRVAIARALIGRPGVLLLDEPFSALDGLTRESLHAVLLDLCADARPAVLLVTHDVDEAMLLADRVLVMRPSPGRIVASIAVDLPRPRGRDAPAFTALRRRVTGATADAGADLMRA